MKMLTNFFRKWSKDHTTLLKGSDVFSPKKHIFIEYVWTQYLCVYFSQQKKMIVKDEDNFDGAFPFDSLFEQWFALIKFFLFLVPVKKVPYYGHCMMGLELKIDISVAPLVLTSILKKLPSEAWHFIQSQKRVKILRRLIEIFFSNISP